MRAYECYLPVEVYPGEFLQLQTLYADPDIWHPGPPDTAASHPHQGDNNPTLYVYKILRV